MNKQRATASWDKRRGHDQVHQRYRAVVHGHSDWTERPCRRALVRLLRRRDLQLRLLQLGAVLRDRTRRRGRVLPAQFFQKQCCCPAHRQKGAQKAVLKSASIRRFLSYLLLLLDISSDC